MLKLSDWFKANKPSLNIQKSNYIIFKPRQWRDEFTLNIEMNGVKTKQVKEVNFLGLILDDTIVMKTPYFSGCEQSLQVFALLGQLCVLYTIHLSILIFNIAF